MKGCLRTLIWALLIWAMSQVLYEHYLKTTDKDYDVGIPEVVIRPMNYDSIEAELDKPSTKPYKQNPVDVQ